MTEYKDIQNDVKDNTSYWKGGINSIPGVLMVIAHELRELNENIKILTKKVE